MGLSGPTVSIDSNATISFSIGITETMNEYEGTAFTLKKEIFSVETVTPNINTSISYDDSAPTFVWVSKKDTPQNYYILEIDYLNNGTYFTKSTKQLTYTLSSSEWDQIKNDAPFTNTVKKIYWRIRINGEEYPNETYYSPWTEATISNAPLTSQENLIIQGQDRYVEKFINLGYGGYKDFYITFAQGKTKLIQTFGSTDTVLELYSSSGTLLKSNDDGGYNTNGFLAYYFTANVQYKLRVKFKSTSTYGNTKLAITPACGAPKQGLSAITTYDDIRTAEGTSATWLTYAQPYYTRVLVFKPTVSGDYKFEIESEFDTYLYVINPSSTASLVYNVNYNDNSGEGNNPLMTTYLTANVPYLVIYSAYNPASLTEDLDLTLRISKQ